MSWYQEWRPYVPVAKRRAKAAAFAKKIAKKEGRELAPITLEGRKIVTTYWGRAWCDNLEQYSDFANRLPRGRTYVRNGSVIDLLIERGTAKAIVSGSEIYRVKISIATLSRKSWDRIKGDCSQSIHSLIDLLQGRFGEGVMQRLAQRDGGLFPEPKEIKMSCSCPDWAGMCKHVAATLYGVGARLDTAPELLFTLRDVDHFELISQAVAAENIDRSLEANGDAALAEGDLGKLFGIEIDAGEKPAKKPRRPKTAKTPQVGEAANGKRAKKPTPSRSRKRIPSQPAVS